MTPRNILVVGGNGFIGRHVAARAASLGWGVTCLGSSGAGPQGARLIAADISNRDELRRALHASRFDYVVNCGGYIDHQLFASGGRRLVDAHFVGVMNLVEMIDRESLRTLVNIGSSDEYGDAGAPQSEELREAPISPYSAAKVAATHFLQMLHRTEVYPAVTLRLFLTYGPGQDIRRFLPQVIGGCLDARSFPTSAGEQLRDFCYIEDTVSAIFSALDQPRALGQVINIASGAPVRIRDVIENIRRIVGAGTPLFGELPYRPGENMALFADVAKAERLLSWRAVVGLAEGLERTIEWVRQSR